MAKPQSLLGVLGGSAAFESACADGGHYECPAPIKLPSCVVVEIAVLGGMFRRPDIARARDSSIAANARHYDLAALIKDSRRNL